LAELVQVKKSEALGLRRRTTQTESWRIDVPQLRTLLSMSESSCYWLILATGEVACVSSRVVQGLGQGRSALKQGSFTMGYNDIRHAAVRLQQFLPELLLGAWVGSVDDKTLRFAQGEDMTIRPRHIFEITLTLSTDQ
jgi:hypothetical protein